MRKELMRFKRMWVHKNFFQSKMVLDIPKKEEEEEYLEKEAEKAVTDQMIDLIKGTCQLV
jgi:hypothetical protein